MKRLGVGVGLCACGLVAGCTLDSLWGFDAPRPSLHSDDVFDVEPLCRDLIVDSDALAPVPVYVTLTGKRRATALGAESVPVVVTRGRCPSGSAPVVTCDRDAEALPDKLFEAFHLVEGPSDGCRVRSPARLDCTLDPRGEASFGVEAFVSEDQVASGGYVPVCVTPSEFGIDGDDDEVDGGKASFERKHRQELWVLPRAGSVRLALATIAVDRPEGNVVSDAGPDGTTDCGDAFQCDEARKRVGLQAGFASLEIPAGSLRPQDFEPVRLTQLTASLSVFAQPAEGKAYLATDDCDASSGSNELDLTIGEGATATPVFYLCAPGHSANYSVVTRRATEQPDGGAPDAGAEADGGVSPVRDGTESVVRALELPLASQAEGFVVSATGELRPVETRLCDGTTVLTPSTGPIDVRESPALKLNDESNVVLECPESADDAGGDESACSSPTIAVQLKDGHTCSLELAP